MKQLMAMMLFALPLAAWAGPFDGIVSPRSLAVKLTLAGKKSADRTLTGTSESHQDPRNRPTRWQDHGRDYIGSVERRKVIARG
jgi:hypothetical protein